MIKKYEIYKTDTGEVLINGSNEFTALNNLAALRRRHGEDLVQIRWIDNKNKAKV